MPISVTYKSGTTRGRSGKIDYKTASVSRGMNTPILFFAVVPDDKAAKPSVKPRSGNDLEDIVAEFQRRASRMVGQETLKIMKQWLGKGGRYNIGYEGKAADNLTLLGPKDNGRGGVFYYVAEGGRTRHNYIIRHGLEPGQVKEYQDGDPITRLKAWAKKRGLKYQKDKDAEFQVKSKRHSLARHKKFDVWTEVAHKVWNSAKTKGTSAWYARHPWGNRRGDSIGYFNYPQKFNDDNRDDIEYVMRRISSGNTWHHDFEGEVREVIIGALSYALRQNGKYGEKINTIHPEPMQRGRMTTSPGRPRKRR